VPSLGGGAAWQRHIAWDIGAAALAEELSRRLDAPLLKDDGYPGAGGAHVRPCPTARAFRAQEKASRVCSGRSAQGRE
jgi:hypothetical protein